MADLNGITSADVKARIKQINEETPIFWTASFIKEPQELTVRTTARNNIMLEKVLENQAKIIANQNIIAEKLGLGEKLDVKV